MATRNRSWGLRALKDQQRNGKSADDEFMKIWNDPETERLAHSSIQLMRSRALGGRLKTLREIEVFSSRLNEKIAYSSCLRQEAIRHIRHQQAKGDGRQTVEWIKNFLNVTDQDIVG